MQSSKDSFSDRVNSLKDDLKLYIEKRIELWALSTGERFATLISKSMHRITGFVLLALGGIFALIGLSIYLGNVLGDPWLGYLIVAAPLVLIGLFSINLRPKSIRRKIKNRMMEDFFRSLPDDIGSTDNEGDAFTMENDKKRTNKDNSAKMSKKERP